MISTIRTSSILYSCTGATLQYIIYERGGYLKEYSLYLDETKPNTSNPYFCLAGFVIENDAVTNDFEAELSRIKSEILNTSAPLHAYHMRKCESPFEIMSDKEVRSKFYEAFTSLIKNSPINVLGTIINSNDYSKIYNSYDDIYEVLFHPLLENFIHFLSSHNAVGTIYMESRNPKEDSGILREYYKLYLNGSLFYHSSDIQERILNVIHLKKSENNLCLQFADFIPGYLVRLENHKTDIYNIGKTLREKIYNVSSSNLRAFGFKKISL